MEITKTMLTVIFLIFMTVGCTTTSTIQTDTNNLQKLKGVKTAAISEFKCSDPVVARNIRNTIIEVLLTQYSVIIGDEADVIIIGTITLSNDQIPSKSMFESASPKSVDSYVSEINVQIIKNKRTMTSATVTQVRTDSWTPDPPEVIAGKMATKIKEILLKW